jgi:hypothetical protein
MPYMGELKHATPYAIIVDAGAVVSKFTMLTIEKINTRDKFQAVETFLVNAQSRATFNDTAEARIDRLIIRAHPPHWARPNSRS